MIEVSVKYIVTSQDIVINEFKDEKEAKEFVKSSNEKWLDYKQKCLDSGEDYADNRCVLYEQIQYDNGTSDLFEIEVI